MKNIKTKVDKMERAVRKAGEPTPDQVGRAMMHYGERGAWPTDATPKTIELAKALQMTSSDIMGVV